APRSGGAPPPRPGRPVVPWQSPPWHLARHVGAPGSSPPRPRAAPLLLAPPALPPPGSLLPGSPPPCVPTPAAPAPAAPHPVAVTGGGAPQTPTARRPERPAPMWPLSHFTQSTET